MPPTPTSESAVPPHAARVPSRRSRFAAGVLFFFAIALPAVTLAFELVSGLCAQFLFDPIPTAGHTLLVALVPAANLLAWRSLRRTPPDGRPRRWARVLNGAALASAVYYAMLFAPVTPFAVIGGVVGMIYFGAGLLALLPLAPLIGVFATWRYGILLRRAEAAAGRPRRPRWGSWGALATALAVAILAAPSAITHFALRWASSDGGEPPTAALRVLRAIGDRDIMIRACYRQAPMGADLFGWLAAMSKTLPPERARALYYRATGETFDTRPSPTLGFRRRFDPGGDFDWDPEQGGDVVAGRLKGLSLADSRLDGTVEPAAGLAYLEWTLVFRNDAAVQREARAQLRLPEGACVSRLTLWIDGEPREAAFGGRSQTKQAYQRVVQRLRDPVLVTTMGPDRVLVQCFPVPPNGGTMKVRLGITAPLDIVDAANARVPFPQFVERNFRLVDGLRHAAWIRSPSPLSPSADGWRLAADGREAFADLVDADWRRSPAPLSLALDPAISTVWTEALGDPATAAGAHILGRWEDAPTAPVDSLAIVIDGSAPMRPAAAAVAAALAELPGDRRILVLFAGDRTEELARGGKPDAGTLARLSRRLRPGAFAGGCDNVPALLEAWAFAAEAGRGAVLWLHGPQPQALSPGEALRQRLERHRDGPILCEVPLADGPNRLLEQLDGPLPLRAVRPSVPPADAIRSVVAELADGRRERRLAVERAVNPPPAGAPRASSHLARLWANRRTRDLLAEGRRAEALSLSTGHQIVTPVSGAVVLETARQYAEAGLEPADARHVPDIPEPGTMLLLLAGTAAAFAARGARRARRRGPASAPRAGRAHLRA